MTRRNNRKLHLGSAFPTEATEALARLVAPLLRAQCVSIRQFTLVLKKAAIQFEASRFARTKVNKARIAFSIGSTRGTVSRLLGQGVPARESDIQAIVRAWRSEATDREQDGYPADIPIYGRGKTFERLAKRYGKGIPVRAILDELVDRGAVVLLPAQKVHLQEDFPGPEYEFWARLTSLLESQVNDALLARAENQVSAAAPRTHFKRRRA